MSAIVQFTDYDGSRGLRIVAAQEPECATRSQPGRRLLQTAGSSTQQQTAGSVERWVDQKIKSVYLRVDPIYDGCENMQELIRASYDLGRK